MGFNLGTAFSSHPAELVVFALIVVLAVPVVGLIWVLASWYLAARLNPANLREAVAGRHILVTGASKGLGKAIAIELAKSGASVTLFARGQAALDQAVSEVRSAVLKDEQIIQGFSVDLSDYDSVAKAVASLRDHKSGLPYWVIANAGAAQPGFLADQLPTKEQPSAVQTQINSNYYTATNIVMAVLAACKASAPAAANGESGPLKIGLTHEQSKQLPAKFIFVSSAMSVLAFIGYSSYAASKHALRGFVDAIRTELMPYSVDVHQYLPANMATAGFEEEEKLKPKITAQIEGAGNMQAPEVAAKWLLAGVVNGRYCIANDAIVELARVSVNGAGPRPNFLAEVAATPLLALIFTSWSMIMRGEILTYFKKKSD
ncbi:3-dehydrosphinganine reductase [Rhizophlyctis rosea]|uniref:3-dehydrosphinganine reductase n=1 Tax=Rhizophlyctis rosea TaxID=64517 RepID=A0AAD5SKG8_9FUNG|nr:3-dehydrosphinganine reductase [Rhizophlyctis rosea]